VSVPTPEFSRPVALARLGREPLRVEIEASADECARLARRFGLLTLDRLSAVVTLRRETDGRIRLDACFEAEFTQDCVVTLDPVAGRIASGFALVYGPAEDGPAELDIDADGPVFEPLGGDAIDIAEAVAQELSLALPEFPRLPDAEIEPLADGDPQGGPFAGLAKLNRPPHG
jgi:uncharacterized metal-binding protein YceD (DUF177 family)